MATKDGAWLADAKLAAGIDPEGKTWPLNCDNTGTLKVTLTAEPVIEIGSVRIEDTSGDILTSIDGSLNVNVTNSPIPEKAIDAISTEETVFMTKTALLPPNINRLGLVIQIRDLPVNIWLGNAAVPAYELTKGSVLEIENFIGSVFGSVNSGSSSILVTEKI